MIIPDINLLLYAHDSSSPYHRQAREWWAETIDRAYIGLPWVVSLGLIRLATNPRLVSSPRTVKEVSTLIGSWLSRSNFIALEPGPKYLEQFEILAAKSHAGSNLVTDLHLAALAIEHKATLYSNDTDFARFPGLLWKNPLNRDKL